MQNLIYGRKIFRDDKYSGQGSVKTTIPISMARQFGYKSRRPVRLVFRKDMGMNELVMVVRKEGTKIRTKYNSF